MSERFGNNFLDTLPGATAAGLRPHLERVELARGEAIVARGEALRYVVFPVGSIVSTLTYLPHQAQIEVGLTGHDGLVGFLLLLGERTSFHNSVVLLPGPALRVAADVFAGQAAFDADLCARTFAYARYAMSSVTQFAACNRLHPIEERFARWVLMVSDRFGGQNFVLAHESVEQMLGVRRGSIMLAASAMTALGLITYRRGVLQIVDRAALEDAACECYAFVDTELTSVMGYGARLVPDETVTVQTSRAIRVKDR